MGEPERAGAVLGEGGVLCGPGDGGGAEFAGTKVASKTAETVRDGSNDKDSEETEEHPADEGKSDAFSLCGGGGHVERTDGDWSGGHSASSRLEERGRKQDDGLGSRDDERTI